MKIFLKKMMSILKNKSLSYYLWTVGSIFFIVVIFGYAFFQARNIILGPVIKIQEPQNGVSLEHSLVGIEGTAKNISHISMNDRQIFTDEQGQFREKLLLSYGYNIITIKAKDRFGRKTKKTLELIYK
ncbi:MAG: hypothetical protein QGG63_01490 [Candidatus Pacebacteria bacterium]|jgi:hypothetical protein|nr:hypothetical protein [Candidatus Paceibacterota bacterium]|tara:strand:+ start:4236 stop:4619 length:384 start_codon:yes stop_codon:yes gene_type:complete